MLVGRRPQLLKFACIAVVALLFVTLATKQRISQSFSNVYNQVDIIEQVEEKKANDHEHKDISTNKNINNKNSEQSEPVENNLELEDGDVPMPFDDRMPGAYLRFKEPADTNNSYCKYNYDMPYDLESEDKIKASSPEEGESSPYRILYNVIEAYDTQNTAQVTYATHMTANFANFIPQLLRYWDGLVTIAAFVPDLDAALFLEQVNQYCYCEPEMHRLSIHLVTHKTVPFSRKDINFNRPDYCIPEDSSKVSIYKDYEDTMFYPVNVLRNVARTSALTKYILSSDIELMPSKGLASGFLSMIEKYKELMSPKEVFVVPIFEVEEAEAIPENKEELLRLIEEEKAVYFHEVVCKHCQKFAGIDEWYSNGFGKEVKPLLTVKRQKPYNRWEPLFIGTNEEPLYSEKLSWEGLQDKMTQSLEMCLMDYDYTILDNAFLCHWPGIKKQKVASEDWRVNYVLENKAAYKDIIENLQKKYVDIPGCMVNDTTAVLPTKASEKIVF